MRTPLSRWAAVPASYEGLLIDTKRRSTLKRNVTDVKVGPLRHVAGRHVDGDGLSVAVQVCAKYARLLGLLTPQIGYPVAMAGATAATAA
jgi:gamma-glutamylcysteine synthetase